MAPLINFARACTREQLIEEVQVRAIEISSADSFTCLSEGWRGQGNQGVVGGRGGEAGHEVLACA